MRNALVIALAGMLFCHGVSVDPDYTQGMPPGKNSCSPLSAEACTDTGQLINEFGDTLQIITIWQPETRNLYELAYRSQWFDGRNSFRHVYNSALKDSIVYWIEYIDSVDTSYNGWGIYEYDSNGNLIYIGNYNGWDGQQYGYFKYDQDGNLIEQMQDGFVEEYDSNGNILRSYTIQNGDTTFLPVAG